MPAETTTSLPPNPTMTRLAELVRVVLRQLDELIDVWSELTDILAERTEVIGTRSDGGEPACLGDDENHSDVIADVVRALERQLSTLRASEHRVNDRFACLPQESLGEPNAEAGASWALAGPGSRPGVVGNWTRAM
jgi:hypothetical protein